jgi:hypothetical protein
VSVSVPVVALADLNLHHKSLTDVLLLRLLYVFFSFLFLSHLRIPSYAVNFLRFIFVPFVLQALLYRVFLFLGSTVHI